MLASSTSDVTRERISQPLTTALRLLLDVMLLTVATIALVIIATGGGSVEISGVRIRAQSIENPIWVLTTLLLLRYFVRSAPHSDAAQGLSFERSIVAARDIVSSRLRPAATRLFERPIPVLVFISGFALVVKLTLAWMLPGFFSGDDVEIHEMSLGILLQKDWPIWSLRSAFFPLGFVYPAQRFAYGLGGTSPEVLIFAGRGVVALLSTAVIPLTWLAARQLLPTERSFAAIAVMFVTVNKLMMSFGSSELPRPVATVFVLAAFVCLLSNLPWRSAAAGVLIGLAASFRFSEAMFLPATLITLGLRRDFTGSLIVLLTSTVTFLAVTGLSDLLYWGKWFSSLTAAFDYTLIQRQSSRGFDPPWAYVMMIPSWSTLLIVALAAVGTSRRNPDSWWLWVPLGLLSLLPHKESRYVIPIIPFLSLAAARGVVHVSDAMCKMPFHGGWRGLAADLFAPILLLSVLHEVGGWRLARSNEAVRLAKRLRTAQPASSAAQDYWRLGSRIYLSNHEPWIDLSEVTLRDPAIGTILQNVHWVALRIRTARTIGDSILTPLGFVRDSSWQGQDYVLYKRQESSRRRLYD